MLRYGVTGMYTLLKLALGIAIVSSSEAFYNYWRGIPTMCRRLLRKLQTSGSQYLNWFVCDITQQQHNMPELAPYPLWW